MPTDLELTERPRHATGQSSSALPISVTGNSAFIDPERKPFHIEGHKLESQSLEDAGKLRRHLGGQRPRQFFARNFDADNISVMPDPVLPEAQSAQSVFTLLDHLKRLARDLASIFDAR